MHMMSIFTGVKMINIACSLVRNKLIAILIGPVGIGLVILYNSVLEMAGNASRMSIDQSAIREITADSTPAHRADITAVVRRWSLWLGLVGMGGVCIFSPLLSRWTFGDTTRWWTFCLLSPVPLLSTLNMGRQALMQGLGQLPLLAKASALGAVVATVLSVSLIWLVGVDAIIPMLLIYAAAMLAATIWLSPRTPRSNIDSREILRRGKGFVRLGAVITAALIAGQLAGYLFILYLNHSGHTAMVGIYQSGYMLVNTYVGVILTGIWAEYFPRLGRAIHSKRSTSVIVSNQISLTISLSLPLVLMLIGLDRFVISLLYAGTFDAVTPYVTIGSIGVIPRAFAFCMSFVILAKGDGHAFIATEIISAIAGLCLNIAGYSLAGMTGLGVSYIVWYTFYCLIVGTVYTRRYRLALPRGLIAITAGCTLIALGALCAKLYLGWWAPVIMALAAAPVCLRRILRPSRRTV